MRHLFYKFLTSFSAFIFRPTQRLVPDDEFASRPVYIDDQSHKITSASILPTLEYFVQFSIFDLTSIYCTIIDTFTEELFCFNILPENEIHLHWMIRARGFLLQYGTSRLPNENFDYNMAQTSIDIVIRDFFHLRRLFCILISDVLNINGTSAASMAQLPVFSEPL